MEWFVHGLLVEWTLLCFSKETFVHVAIVGTQSWIQNRIGYVEAIDDSNGIRTYFRQTQFHSLVQLLHIALGDGGELDELGRENRIIREQMRVLCGILTLSRSPTDFKHVSYADNSTNWWMTAANSFDKFLSMFFVTSWADRNKNDRQCASAHWANSMPVALLAFSSERPCFLRNSKCW